MLTELDTRGWVNSLDPLWEKYVYAAETVESRRAT